jgi:hypothetical protein
MATDMKMTSSTQLIAEGRSFALILSRENLRTRMLRRIVWCKFTDVSEALTVTIIKVIMEAVGTSEKPF